MKTKINGYEVECTVEEFKQLSKTAETKVVTGTPYLIPKKLGRPKGTTQRKVVTKRISWDTATIKKYKELNEHYSKTNMLVKDMNKKIAKELGTTPLAVARQRTVLKISQRK